MPAKAGIHDSIRKRTGCLAGEIDPSLRWGDGAGDDCFPPNAIMLRLLWHPSDGVASLREMLDRVAVDGDPGDRKSVVWGKSVSVSVDLGGRRNIKKKKK